MKYIGNPVKFFLGILAICWALAFVKYLGHWVYFPVFPNILDSVGMALVGVYLLYDCAKRK